MTWALWIRLACVLTLSTTALAGCLCSPYPDSQTAVFFVRDSATQALVTGVTFSFRGLEGQSTEVIPQVPSVTGTEYRVYSGVGRYLVTIAHPAYRTHESEFMFGYTPRRPLEGNACLSAFPTYNVTLDPM